MVIILPSPWDIPVDICTRWVIIYGQDCWCEKLEAGSGSVLKEIMKGYLSAGK